MHDVYSWTDVSAKHLRNMMLVDSGASKQSLRDSLLRNEELQTASRSKKKIVAAGNRELRETATRIVNGTTIDQTGKTHRVRFPILRLSGLRRHAISSFATMKRGNRYTREESNPQKRRGGVMVPLQLQTADLSLI